MELPFVYPPDILGFGSATTLQTDNEPDVELWVPDPKVPSAWKVEQRVAKERKPGKRRIGFQLEQ